MPHRVATFIRSHTNSFDLTSSEKKKKNIGAAVQFSPIVREGSISSTSSISFTSMPDARHKRRSLAGHISPRSSSKSLGQDAPTNLDIEIESPPLLFFGAPSSSTGALLSGQLKMNVVEERFAIESFQMKLVIDVKMKKPFHTHCTDCAQQTTELTCWKFLEAPAVFNRGEHDFPFSFLLPGHLPATMHGSLSTIDYVLRARVTPKVGEPIILTKEINVKRAVQPSELPRQSIRVFPPTNLTSHVELPSIIHPIGEFNTSMRLDGIIRRNTDGQTQTHWRLKRLTWRLDETQKVISPACAKHAMKAGAAPDEKKGVAHQDLRTLNSEELKSGWKADYSAGADGNVYIEFPFSIRADPAPICDLKSGDGTEVSHALVLELIVAEEVAQIKRPNHATPTGAARVLRMSFNVTLTERSGLGISWDKEQPPTYENVPASPPEYGRTEEYLGTPIPDYEGLGTLRE